MFPSHVNLRPNNHRTIKRKAVPSLNHDPPQDHWGGMPQPPTSHHVTPFLTVSPTSTPNNKEQASPLSLSVTDLWLTQELSNSWLDPLLSSRGAHLTENRSEREREHPFLPGSPPSSPPERDDHIHRTRQGWGRRLPMVTCLCRGHNWFSHVHYQFQDARQPHCPLPPAEWEQNRIHF